jgi:uncharacterized protein (UPF0303 family)
VIDPAHRARLRDDLARLAEQRDALRFASFDEDDAWAVLDSIRSIASERGHAVAIEVRLSGHTVAFLAMVGTSPANADWARRKRNLVELVHRSSYEVGLDDALSGRSTLDLMGLSGRDHASHGGSVPIVVRDVGVVGSVTVSGLPQRADHELVVEALAVHAGVDVAAIRLG